MTAIATKTPSLCPRCNPEPFFDAYALNDEGKCSKCGLHWAVTMTVMVFHFIGWIIKKYLSFLGLLAATLGLYLLLFLTLAACIGLLSLIV